MWGRCYKNVEIKQNSTQTAHSLLYWRSYDLGMEPEKQIRYIFKYITVNNTVKYIQGYFFY